MKHLKLKVSNIYFCNIEYYGLEFRVDTRLWRYAAMDKNGDVHVFTHRPSCDKDRSETYDPLDRWFVYSESSKMYVGNIFVDLYQNVQNGRNKGDVFLHNNIKNHLLPFLIDFEETIKNQDFNSEKIRKGTYEEYFFTVEDWKTTLEMIDYDC